MTPVTLALKRAELRIQHRLAALEAHLDTRDDSAMWTEYGHLAAALSQILTAGERRGDLLTTGELAQKLNVSPRTIRRRKQAGTLRPAMQIGQRVVRWSAEELAR